MVAKKAKSKKKNSSHCSIKYHRFDDYRMVGVLRKNVQ